jgi:hypothetical protein
MEVNQYEDVDEKTELPVLVLTQDGVYLIAFWARVLTGHGFEKKFNPINVMENIVPIFDSSFNFHIIDESEWMYDISIHAYYDVFANIIVIRNDVYEKALEGDIQALCTITHELCHYFQFIILNLFNTLQCLEYKTELCSKDSVQMENQENQTDSITCLILKPDELFMGKTDEEIFDFYIGKPLVKALDGLIKVVGKKFLSEVKTLPLYQKLTSEVLCAS